MQPQALQERSDVGVLTSLEIEVYNVGSSILDNIKLQIYYPAASSGTGEYFFLLPECAVTKVWPIVRESSPLTNECSFQHRIQELHVILMYFRQFLHCHVILERGERDIQ